MKDGGPPTVSRQTPPPTESREQRAESTPAVPEKLSLHDAIRLGTEHNANLRQSLTSLENARSRYLSVAQQGQMTLESGVTGTTATRGSGSMMNTVGSAYSRDFLSGTSISFSGTLPWVDSRNQGGQAGLELALPLMRGRGKASDKRVAVEQAAIGLDQERLQYFIARQGLVEQIYRAYFDAMRAQLRIDVQRQAVDIAKTATDDSQKRLDAGLITEIDVTRAKIQLAGAREALLNQEAAYRDALDRLVLLLGLPVGATPELTEVVPEVAAVGDARSALGARSEHLAATNGTQSRFAATQTSPSEPLRGYTVSDQVASEVRAQGSSASAASLRPISSPSGSKATPDLAAAIREALAKRPELRLRQLQMADAVIQQDVARNRKKPRADLTANLAALGLSFLTGGGAGRVLTSVLGLRLSVPVNRVALREDTAMADRNMEQLRRMQEFDRQEIVEEVRSLVRARETAQSNIDLLSENLKVAEQSLRLAQRLIEEGLADNRNLLDAQSSLTQTKSSLISAKIDDMVTSVSLRRALGEDLMGYFGLPTTAALAAAKGVHRPLR